MILLLINYKRPADRNNSQSLGSCRGDCMARDLSVASVVKNRTKRAGLLPHPLQFRSQRTPTASQSAKHTRVSRCFPRAHTTRYSKHAAPYFCRQAHQSSSDPAASSRSYPIPWILPAISVGNKHTVPRASQSVESAGRHPSIHLSIQSASQPVSQSASPTCSASLIVSQCLLITPFASWPQPPHAPITRRKIRRSIKCARYFPPRRATKRSSRPGRRRRPPHARRDTLLLYATYK